MKRIILVIIALSSLLLLFRQPARAQNPVEAESMQIDIWPEYDRKDALVIYRILLSAQTSLPAQISLRMPREAVQPYNFAYKDVDNKLYNMQYNSTVEGDWLRITATSPAQEIQFEYYDSRLARTGTTRLFDYKWPGDLKVKNMTFRVQQPVNASAMKITPQQGTASVEGGLTYYAVVVGAVEAGTTFNFQMSYTKSDDALSAASQPVQPSEPISTNQVANTGLTGDMTTIIIGFALGVVLIAIGLFWYFRTQRREPAYTGRRRHAPAASEPSYRGNNDGDKSVYCHKCGKRSNPGDAFCRACGTRLRQE